MPTYEYKCTQDGTVFELWQEVGADAPPCPSCGGATKKVFHPTRTIFKGSGFYITDTRSESGGAKSSTKANETEAKTETPTPAETKTESKPDTTPPAAT